MFIKILQAFPATPDRVPTRKMRLSIPVWRGQPKVICRSRVRILVRLGSETGWEGLPPVSYRPPPSLSRPSDLAEQTSVRTVGRATDSSIRYVVDRLCIVLLKYGLSESLLCKYVQNEQYVLSVFKKLNIVLEIKNYYTNKLNSFILRLLTVNYCVILQIVVKIEQLCYMYF